MDEAAADGKGVGVSAISMAEIVYLSEKGRLPAGAYADLKRALEDPDHVFMEVPLTFEIVEDLRLVAREAFRTCRIGSLRRQRSLWVFP